MHKPSGYFCSYNKIAYEKNILTAIVPSVSTPRVQGQRLGGRQGNLNPDLPLLELFWRTLLPWNMIDSSRRRQG